MVRPVPHESTEHWECPEQECSRTPADEVLNIPVCSEHDRLMKMYQS